MKSSFLAGAFTVLFTVSAAQAASEAYVDQIGSNLTAISASQMVSISDVTTMTADAVKTISTVRNQFDLTGSSAALLVQQGEGHSAQIDQTGRGNLGVVMQSGLLNSAAIMQTGRGNSAIIAQTGYMNYASVAQTGRNHSAFVAQQGRGNVAIISQR